MCCKAYGESKYCIKYTTSVYVLIKVNIEPAVASLRQNKSNLNHAQNIQGNQLTDMVHEAPTLGLYLA